MINSVHDLHVARVIIMKLKLARIIVISVHMLVSMERYIMSEEI